MWPGRPSRSSRSQPGPLELSGSRDKAGGSADVREPTQNKSPGRGHGGGVEKYSRFLQPPLHPAGHDWETKPLQQRLPLKGCSPPHIWLCVGRCRSGGTALFSCMRQPFLWDLHVCPSCSSADAQLLTGTSGLHAALVRLRRRRL